MPLPQLITPSDTALLASFSSATKSLANLLCKSVQYNDNLKLSSNTAISVASAYTDFTAPQVINKLLSVSTTFRQSLLQTKCSGSRHLECPGFCISVTSFKDVKYFKAQSSFSGLVTMVHAPKLIDLSNSQDVATEAAGYDFIFTLPVVTSYNKTQLTVQVGATIKQ